MRSLGNQVLPGGNVGLWELCLGWKGGVRAGAVAAQRSGLKSSNILLLPGARVSAEPAQGDKSENQSAG